MGVRSCGAIFGRGFWFFDFGVGFGGSEVGVVVRGWIWMGKVRG